MQSNTYILHGGDDYSRREALERLKDGLGSPEILSANTTVLDGPAIAPELLANYVNTVPFLAEHRLIIVEGFLGRWESKEPRGRRGKGGRTKGSQDLGQWAGLDSTIREMPPTTVLVFNEGPLSRENPGLKLLGPGARVTEFPILKGPRLHKWIQERMARANGAISSAAVRLLADVSGGSLWMLSEEIDKLSLYAGGRAVSEEDIRKLVPAARDTNIFVLIDAVIEGKPSRACRELHYLLEGGATAPYILAMVSRQLRMLALSRDLSARGLAETEVGRRLGIASPYALGKVIEQSALYSLTELTDAYEMVLATDLEIKSSELPERLALELLVVRLASRRVRRGAFA